MTEFNEWVAQCCRDYGVDASELDELSKAAILTFDYDEKGKVSARHNGKVVFRNRMSESTILPGETWICRLELNPSTGANYFAKPVARLDASFMYELKKDQLDEIASFVWERQRHTLEPQLEQKYLDAVQRTIDMKQAEAREEASKQVSDLTARIGELERKAIEDQKIIASLEKKLKAAQEAGAAAEPGISGAMPDATVYRVGPDAIESDFFRESRYFVHLSADHRLLEAHPHPDGNVVCVDSVIMLEGLSCISPFAGRRMMASEYSSEYGGLLIRLRRQSLRRKRRPRLRRCGGAGAHGPDEKAAEAPGIRGGVRPGGHLIFRSSFWSFFLAPWLPAWASLASSSALAFFSLFFFSTCFLLIAVAIASAPRLCNGVYTCSHATPARDGQGGPRISIASSALLKVPGHVS